MEGRATFQDVYDRLTDEQFESIKLEVYYMRHGGLITGHAVHRYNKAAYVSDISWFDENHARKRCECSWAGKEGGGACDDVEDTLNVGKTSRHPCGGQDAMELEAEPQERGSQPQASGGTGRHEEVVALGAVATPLVVPLDIIHVQTGAVAVAPERRVGPGQEMASLAATIPEAVPGAGDLVEADTRGVVTGDHRAEGGMERETMQQESERPRAVRAPAAGDGKEGVITNQQWDKAVKDITNKELREMLGKAHPVAPEYRDLRLPPRVYVLIKDAGIKKVEAGLEDVVMFPEAVPPLMLRMARQFLKELPSIKDMYFKSITGKGSKASTDGRQFLLALQYKLIVSLQLVVGRRPHGIDVKCTFSEHPTGNPYLMLVKGICKSDDPEKVSTIPVLAPTEHILQAMTFLRETVVQTKYGGKEEDSSSTKTCNTRNNHMKAFYMEGKIYQHQSIPRLCSDEESKILTDGLTDALKQVKSPYTLLRGLYGLLCYEDRATNQFIDTEFHVDKNHFIKQVLLHKDTTKGEDAYLMFGIARRSTWATARVWFIPRPLGSR
jgi:hypothetical protein